MPRQSKILAEYYEYIEQPPIPINELIEQPKKLYKYQPFTVHSIENLEKQQIYLARPIEFNDPNEFTVIPQDKYSDDERMKLYLHFLSMVKARQGALEVQYFQESYLSEDKANDDFVKFFLKSSDATIQRVLSDYREERGVACFSSNKYATNMWAHYADNHSGVCLEFAAESEPFSSARQVRYVNEFPVTDFAKVLVDRDHYELIINMIYTKLRCWEHEKEWRIFQKKGGKAKPYSSNALTGICFGSKMDNRDRDKIITILNEQNSDVKLYMACHNRETHILNWEPYDPNSEGG